MVLSDSVKLYMFIISKECVDHRVWKTGIVPSSMEQIRRLERGQIICLFPYDDEVSGNYYHANKSFLFL